MSIFRNVPWKRDGRTVFALYEPPGKKQRNAFYLQVTPDYAQGTTVTEKECVEIAEAIESLPEALLFIREITEHLRRGGYSENDVFGKMYLKGQSICDKLNL